MPDRLIDETQDAHHSRLAFHAWMNPPNTQLPVRCEEVRFAVGTPDGVSTNSWKLWARRDDVYLACRDNFQDLRLSLHASGIWRLALTSIAVQEKPSLLLENGDRVLRKWKPDLTLDAILAFEIVVPADGLNLSDQHRKTWPNSIVFVEPAQGEYLTSIAIVIVKNQEPLSFTEAQPGIVLGIVPLADGRSAQIVVTSLDPEPFAEKIIQAVTTFEELASLTEKYPEGVLPIIGQREEGSSWIAVLPHALLVNTLKSIAN